jgi:hemerythrin-like domain-containing protein
MTGTDRSATDATRCLRDHHQLIVRVLNCFDVVLFRALEVKKVEAAEFGPFLEFFRDYADQCHHVIEEDRLFPCMERCGFSLEEGPIRALLDEHRQGRRRVRLMLENLEAADQGDAASVQIIVEQGLAFRDLLRGHIGSEDGHVFNLADDTIAGEELRRLSRSYREAQASDDYQELLERSIATAGEIIARYDST